jgi:succinyl-diaminopimelate desuccinylase
MKERIVSLAQTLIAIPSDPNNKEALAEILERTTSAFPNLTVERFERNGTVSALVYKGSKRPKKFKLLLNGHLDVIPGKPEQYIPKVKGNRLYGVGAMDMKGNLAAMMCAFADMVDNVSYPLGLQLTTDEELGGFDGTKYQIDQGVRADFVLTSEPTNFDIVHQARGVLWLNITATGKTAHGAYPWRGENAVERMNDFLRALAKKYPNPKKEQWKTSVNIASVETSNRTFNKIPDKCTVSLDIRFIPKDARIILPTIKKMLPKGFTLDVRAHEPVLDTDAAELTIAVLKQSITKILKKKPLLRGAFGSSDARHYACPGIEFGPIGAGIGSDTEWVDMRSLTQFYDILVHFFRALDTQR